MCFIFLIKSYKNFIFFIYLMKYLKIVIGNVVRMFICRVVKKKFFIYFYFMLVLICGKDLLSFLFVFVNLLLRKKFFF